LDLVASITREKLNLILVELRHQLEALYGSRLVNLVLYGSQARGDPEPGSDIDVLVVLEGPVDPDQEIQRTSEIVAALSLKHGVLISRMFVDRDRAATENSPFLNNVRRDGIVFNGTLENSPQSLTKITTRGTRAVAGVTMKTEQLSLLRKASDSLQAAKLLADQGYYDIAASRAYYVMFYVAKAFLLEEGLTPSKHSTVISAFGERFAKSNRLPARFHRYLIDAQDQRLTADYKIGADFTNSMVKATINHATEFLELGERQIGPTSSTEQPKP
jgi:uncharacterized protein (UPF0332 family)/predicted nucleotidyltransferase